VRLGDVGNRHPLLRRVVAVVCTLGVAVAALWFAAKGVALADLARTFRNVQWEWIAAGGIASAIQIVSFGMAWRVGLAEGGLGEPPLRHVVSATWIGKAGNAVLPARLGEVARVMVIRRHLAERHGAIPAIAGTLVAQRILNIFATFLVGVSVTLTIGVPVGVPGMRWLVIGVIGAGIAAAVLARRLRLGSRVRRRVPRRLEQTVDRVVQGTGILRSGRAAAAGLALHLASVVAQLVTVACLLRAFDLATPMSAPLVVIAMVALAGAFPAAPGGVGVAQAAIVLPLHTSYGIAGADALAFAIGLQATIALVAIAGGLAGLIHQRFARPHLAGIH
jgi:uncharacterized membrane protein YbhN (UPF0104 family)